MSELELKLVEKDKEIADLKEKNKLKRFQIKDLENRINDRDKEIGKLENQISNLEEIIERKQDVIDNQWLPSQLIISGSWSYVIILDVSDEIKADLAKYKLPKELTHVIQFHRISNSYYPRFEHETINGKSYPVLLKRGLFPNAISFEQLAKDICEYEFGDDDNEEEDNEEDSEVEIFSWKKHRFYFNKHAFHKFMKIFEDKVKTIPEFTDEE